MKLTLSLQPHFLFRKRSTSLNPELMKHPELLLDQSLPRQWGRRLNTCMPHLEQR
jgi:hypothetical protein